MAKLPRVTGGMAACGGSHDWARPWREQGQEVQVMAPQYVTPYGKTQKHDRRDADAIADAVTRPRMRFGPINEVEPQERHALPRGRARLMGARPARVKEMRGRLAEYGIVLPQGGNAFRKGGREKRDAEQAPLTSLRQESFSPLWDALVQLASALACDDAPLDAMSPSHPACPRLRTIPGLGPITATALRAAISAVDVCTPGRHCAAGWGLGPTPPATGGQTRW